MSFNNLSVLNISVTNFSARNASIQTLYAKNSISADGPITATGQITGGSFNATSDTRVKTNIELLNCKTSLEILRELKPSKYDMIDAYPNQLGFIAQEIKQIPLLKSSVHDEGTAFIPNIYRTLHCDQGWFSIDQSLNLTDKLRYKKDGAYHVTTLIASKDSMYQMEDSITGDLFIYGTEVSDFHSIQKDMVFTVAVSAIQRLDEIVTQQQKTIDDLLKKIDTILFP
jgi:hypothetical protein